MSDDEDNDFRGHEDMRVPLPIKGIDKVLIPQLFIKRVLFPTGDYERNANGKFKRNENGKKIPTTFTGFTIDLQGNKSINKTRQISSRKGKPVLQLKTAKVEKVEEQRPAYMPRLAEFPKLKDRRIIYNYLTHLHPNDQLEFPHNKTRGLPPILPKNWKHHNLGALPKGYKGKQGKEKKVSHEDIFGNDTESESDIESESDEEEPPTPKKKSPPKKAKKAIPISQLESDSESDEEPSAGGAGGGAGGGKARGRPRKHMTADEAYLAKLKSNKDKRAERRLDERRKKIKEKLAKGEKLTKKEKELHEAEGEGIKDKDPCWEGYEMKGMKMKKDKKVPNCIPKGEGIDFEDIKWGTFKALYNRFMKNNPTFKDKIEDLEHFAHFVVANPDKFSKVAHKKAQFYVNILEHKTEGGKLSKIGQAFNKAFNPQKNGVAKNKFIQTMVKNATSKDDSPGEIPPNDN